MRIMKKRLIVTGASGLFGTSLALQASRGFNVAALYHSNHVSIPGCDSRSCDLRNRKQTLQCLDNLRPDIIIHSAAITDVEQCEADRKLAEQLHVTTTSDLANWAQHHGSYFVYIGTDSVFDGIRGQYREEDTPGPINYYARTKLAGEEVVRDRLLQGLIVRTNFYGWNCQDKLSLGEWILRGLIRRERLTMFTDVKFSPLLVNDLAQIILELIENQASGTFHIAARDHCSKYLFALWLGKIFGLKTDTLIPISVDEFHFKARRPKNTSLAVEKVSQFLGRSMPSVEEGLLSFKALLTNGFVTTLKGGKPDWLEVLKKA